MQETFPDDQSAFITLIEQADMSEIQLMALLHRFGFEKAVIQDRKYVHASFLEVTFMQAGGTIEPTAEPSKEQRP